MANYKALIGISAAIVIGLGGYYLYQTKFKRKEEIEFEEGTEADKQEFEEGTEADKQEFLNRYGSNTPPPSPAPKPKPKPSATAPAPIREPGFVQPPKGPQSVAQKEPAIGAKIFVLSASGANAYKTASATTGNVYKFYKRGKYIGTYLGKKGIFSEVIVQETNAFGITTNKTVFVRSTEIYT